MADSFWNFSLKTYGTPGVAPALLALQAEHGVDLNLVLYACWLGASGRGEADAPHLSGCLSLTRAWQGETAAALRRIKHRLKGWTGGEEVPAQARDAFRKKVAELEIEAERLEQAALEGAAPPVRAAAAPEPERARAAARNLDRLMGALGLPKDDAVEGACRGLLSAAFPGLGEKAAGDLFRAP